MRKREEIRPLRGHRELDVVSVPYARQDSLDVREVLFEVHPYAVVSHLSALVFHGLAMERPNHLSVTISRDVTGGLLPLGTSPTDWEGMMLPAPSRPARLHGYPVTWKLIRPADFFGHGDFHPLGYPIRYTLPERTLIDGLTDPELCGGMDTVLQAWALARQSINLDMLVHQVERMGVLILRQRVGFILDRLGLSHPQLDDWRNSSRRGGSSKLVAARPFASTYDERWNLSINAPIDALLGTGW
jgi:predicted transcriptional regulator of viral defense system